MIKKKKDKKPITAKELRALVKSFPWDEWNQDLAKGFTQTYRDLVVASGEGVAKQNGISFDVEDPFLQQHMTEYVGERITQLSRTTQKDVTTLLRATLASDESLSVAELRDKILETVRERYDDYEAFRALRIARTESAIGFNHGNVLGAAQAGFGKVDVVDGTDDEACAAANGAVWTTTQALNNPIAHPNCTRAFFPHVEEDD